MWLWRIYTPCNHKMDPTLMEAIPRMRTLPNRRHCPVTANLIIWKPIVISVSFIVNLQHYYFFVIFIFCVYQCPFTCYKPKLYLGYFFFFLKLQFFQISRQKCNSLVLVTQHKLHISCTYINVYNNSLSVFEPVVVYWIAVPSVTVALVSLVIVLIGVYVKKTK